MWEPEGPKCEEWIQASSRQAVALGDILHACSRRLIAVALRQDDSGQAQTTQDLCTIMHVSSWPLGLKHAFKRLQVLSTEHFAWCPMKPPCQVSISRRDMRGRCSWPSLAISIGYSAAVRGPCCQGNERARSLQFKPLSIDGWNICRGLSMQTRARRSPSRSIRGERRSRSTSMMEICLEPSQRELTVHAL